MTLSFFRYGSIADRVWAFGQMGLARWALSRTPDLAFWKLLGSGSGEGFTPVPDTSVSAVLCVWPDLETAQERLRSEPVFRRYRARASEVFTVFLAATQVRGTWSNSQPFQAVATPDTGDNTSLKAGSKKGSECGPVVALTRATIRPSVALKFWKRVPDISAMIGADRNVAFKIGVGEVPWLHQVTFSIWPNARVMADFARTSGPHASAIKAVRAGNWFSEELYARFRLLDHSGKWKGRNPLTHLELEPAA